DLDRLRRVADAGSIERAAHQAADAGLARIEGDRLTFEHPAFGSAVYAGMSAARRHAVHLLLANRLADPVESARHLGLATSVPDEAVAARLTEAGRVAAARGAPDLAALLLEDACRLTP